NDRNQNPIPGSPITTENGLPDDRVQAMVAGAGKVWMGTGGMYGMAHGISALDLEQWAFQESLLTASSDPSTGLRTGLPYNYIADLAVGEEGTRWENQVWVATGNKRERKYGIGALLYTEGAQGPGDGTWTQFTKEETDDDGTKPWTGLASNNTTALAIDGDYVWFGTQPVTWEVRWGQWSDGGLSVYDGEQWTIRTDANTGGDRAGMFDDRISALAIGCTDEIWIALGGLRDNSGLGINVLDTMGDPHNLSNDEWWDPFMYRTIPSNLVTGIAPDCVRSQMWISSAPYFTGPGGTIGGGVARYDYETGTWTSWTTRDGIESFELDRNTGEIQSISVGPDGMVWAGAWGTLNLSRQKLIDEWPYVPAAINWFRDGIWSNQVFPHDGWISSIAIDEDGIVWAGTSRGGMDIAHPDGKEDDSLADRAIGGIKLTLDGTAWEAWTPDNSPVVTTDIEVIKVAPDGDVWVGTNGWGIMRFHPKEPATPTPTATQTPTGTLTPPTPTSSPTPSPTLFVTAEAPSPTPTVRVHRAYMSMAAKNWFGRPIWVPTAEPPTATPTPSPTPPATSTPTPTLTPTITSTFTQAPPTATATVTPTPTSTNTPTITLTPSPVPTGTWCASDSTDPACSSANITLFTTKDLYDIAFVDSMHGFIVGEDGFVAHTQDGGDTWTHRTWGSATLRDISMVNNQVAFIAGDNQTILRTTNGGGFFQKMQLPSEMQEGAEDFWAIYALSEDDAWVMGHKDGCILHWNGQEWSFGIAARCTRFQYTGLAMTAPDQGWAISEEGHIYRYAGAWTEFPAARASAPLWAIEMHSPTEGWAAGNAGGTVHYVNGRWAGSVIGGAFAGGGITGLHIRAPDDVWATAAMGTGDRADGAIYRYQSNRWAQVEYRPFKQLNGIWINDTRTNGWAIGNDGFVLRYVIPGN
ncbi:MAG: YCF48-related protein, partial [Anaerolineae bacterium]